MHQRGVSVVNAQYDYLATLRTLDFSRGHIASIDQRGN